MTEYLFVCGTLRPALASGEMLRLMSGLRRVGEGTVRGHLYDLGEYPGAVIDGNATSVVVGEVFELPDDETFLQTLDEYEGFDPADAGRNAFVRTKVPVTLSDETRLECWMYAYNRATAGAPLVAGGDYLKLKGCQKQ
jgi:gamma-glutamylcyclotransferase (GGCT)/AIG2-like uncharacterized protein YtfP